MITIGALNFEYSDKVVARFSNIGKVNVDVLHLEFKSTTPNNTYKYLQEHQWLRQMLLELLLIRSYYPKLTASQVKHILMDSGVLTTDVIVGIKRYSFFSTLSQSENGKHTMQY
jgi:hypothetical protein